jgi:hypothetical protein
MVEYLIVEFISFFENILNTLYLDAKVGNSGIKIPRNLAAW